MNIDLVSALTVVVREADETFQQVGGSSRHWVRDCFLPALQRHGWTLIPTAITLQQEDAERAEAMKIKRANARKKAWQTRRAGGPAPTQE